MEEDEMSRREVQMNMFALRRDLTLPYEIPKDHTVDYMIRMPAALFFSYGQRHFVSNFLMSNVTSRNQMQPWQICQHNRLLTLTMSEFCIWLEEVGATRYIFWVVIALSVYPEVRWFKLFTLGLCHLCALGTLLLSLYCPQIQPSSVWFIAKIYEYEVVVGVPAYAVLSDPVVSVAMVLDMLSSLSYFALALLQVTQFQEAWLYIFGCVYLSRGVRRVYPNSDDQFEMQVWCAFLFMRIFSIFVKKRRWEASFGPVDPGLLAISAFVYTGPLVSLLGATRMVGLFYVLWSIFLPDELHDQAIECFSGLIHYDGTSNDTRFS
ncbi:hypothetical protein AC1031_004470 [Aphanomyces cochlioides]|nr:hypothetical protein AC1031_004470 [Aphanomyces cochlioides]